MGRVKFFLGNFAAIKKSKPRKSAHKRLKVQQALVLKKEDEIDKLKKELAMKDENILKLKSEKLVLEAKVELTKEFALNALRAVANEKEIEVEKLKMDLENALSMLNHETELEDQFDNMDFENNKK